MKVSRKGKKRKKGNDSWSRSLFSIVSRECSINSNKNLVLTKNKTVIQNTLLSSLTDLSVTSDTTYLRDWSSTDKLISKFGSKLPDILDDEFSISTYSSIDSDLMSEGIYFNNDASLVRIDFSNDMEAENRYFNDISDSE